MNALLGLVILVADVIAILDCLKSGKETGQKILWIVLIVVLPLVGMILYFLVGKKK